MKMVVGIHSLHYIAILFIENIKASNVYLDKNNNV